MAKVQISIDDELLERVGAYADENYMSRSGVFTQATVQFLNANETVRYVRELSISMKKIADTGKFDNEVIEQLEDFQRFAEILMNAGGKS